MIVPPPNPQQQEALKYMKIRGAQKREKKKRNHPIDLYTSILKRVEKNQRTVR
jgi:hypothetical protein